MTNHRAEENILNAKAAATATAGCGCGEEVKNNKGRSSTAPGLHRCVTSGSSVGAPHDTSCDQAKNQAPPPPSNDSNNGVTMAPHHRQALAHLYHSSRRSRNFRSVPNSPSAITYAQGDKKLLRQDELKKDVSIIQDTPAQDEPSSKLADVEWSFDIASLVDDDCSTVSSFDGEESFMDSDIFRIQSDCFESNEMNNSIGEPVSSDEWHESVEGRSCKRLRTA